MIFLEGKTRPLVWRRKYQAYSPSCIRRATGGKERLASERDDVIAHEERQGVHAGPSVATRGGEFFLLEISFFLIFP